jgi:hypothetical protein
MLTVRLITLSRCTGEMSSWDIRCRKAELWYEGTYVSSIFHCDEPATIRLVATGRKVEMVSSDEIPIVKDILRLSIGD